MRKYQFGRNNLRSLNKRLFQKSLIQTTIVKTHPIRLFEPYCNKLIGCHRICLWSLSVDGIRIVRRHQYQSFEICEWHHYILHVAFSIEYGTPVIPGIASYMHMKIQARWIHIRYRMNRRIYVKHIFYGRTSPLSEMCINQLHVVTSTIDIKKHVHKSNEIRADPVSRICMSFHRK